MSFLKNLQNKPKETRNQYAFGGAAVIVGMVAFIWVLSLPAQFSGMVAEEGLTKSDWWSQATGFLSTSRDQMANTLAGLRAELATSTNETDEVVEVSPPLTGIDAAIEAGISGEILFETDGVLPQPAPREVRLVTATSTGASSTTQ